MVCSIFYRQLINQFTDKWAGIKLYKGYFEKGIYEKTSINKKYFWGLFIVIIGTLFFVSGCNSKQDQPQEPVIPTPEAVQSQNLGIQDKHSKETTINREPLANSSKMVSYDVGTFGRSNPFMPYGEFQAYENARNSAIAEANAHNANIARINKLKNIRIREEDDINRYGFNFPVPPTSLASGNSTALKITKTKVVGIMYNPDSPSAIINVDKKDYLVRPGDKIIDEKYKVVKINPNWITVTMGANVYSAAIGELFSKEGIQTNQTDMYNLKNRFGGRRG